MVKCEDTPLEASKGGRGCLIIFLSLSVCSFVSLPFTALLLLFYRPAVQIDFGEDPALPLHLVLTFRSSECHKDFHCCVKAPASCCAQQQERFWLRCARVLVCAGRWSLPTPGLWITVNLAGSAVSEGSVCAAGSQSDNLDIENMACGGSVAHSSS